MKRNKGISEMFMLLLFGIIPVLAIGISLVFVASNNLSNELSLETFARLKVANHQFNEYLCETELEELNSLSVDEWLSKDKNYDYVDPILESEGIVMTVFKDDTRVLTSIKDGSGTRLEGTQASEGVIKAVLTNGEHYTSDNVMINGERYYVDYLPISYDGNVIGMSFTGAKYSNISDSIKSVLVVLIGIAVGIMLFFVLLIVVLALRVKAPIVSLTNLLGKFANGYINTEIDVKSIIKENNEMIDSLGILQNNLSQAVVVIRDASGNISNSILSTTELAQTTNSATDQVSAAVSDLSNGATSMAESIQDVNSNVVEMGNALEDIASEVSNLKSSAESMSVVSDDAKKSMNKVMTSSEEMVIAVDKVAIQVAETNKSIERINDAIADIIAVASQTKLLALNASIEAARAGEAGKGFAVVADSIGELSKQSNDSAESIKDIAAEIIKNSGESVKIVENIKNIITEEENDVAEETDEFNLLSDAIQQNVFAIDSIADKVNQIESIKKVIVDAMSDLSAISQENAASSEEVASSVDDITASMQQVTSNMESAEDLTKSLSDSVAFFKD